MTEPPTPRRTAALAVIVACALVGVLLAPVVVTAGDNATTFQFDPHELEAEPGETVTLDLVASTHGGYGGEGIDQLSMDLAYDSDALTVTDVEHGPMLAAENGGADANGSANGDVTNGDDATDGGGSATVDGSVDIDDEHGTVTIEQQREPSSDGAIGTDTAATITLEVAEDAPSTTTLEITDAEATLVTGYPQASLERDATITIGDGGESDADGDDTIPGFTALLAVAAIVAALFWFGRR
ncbi:PGF-CTERM sorting domain-containing protein [Natronorubrum texcoconense]|uniref:PGF-CTERM protein n=1 Tax=Natronorubrum texcoconense TaxID=1095776 RepID=A0A1G8ZS00_9EURY|nr:PGF-CTERM sorting domain-containing protein [Natronorubrum texcoconense]SDK17886.1 PGF-CTERM protein [Natronorubrum texcoconense]